MPDGGVKKPIAPAALTTRDRNIFGDAGSVMFSPGLPPKPDVQHETRVIDFPAGYNLQYTPRSYEAFDFPSLRSFANVELVRLAIETRKDQIERLGWFIQPRDLSKQRRVDHDERVRKVEKFFRKPDGSTFFHAWLRPLIEDLLTIDAPTIEYRRNRGGDLVGLDVVDGATIRILVDETGRRPKYPNPAYQQIIKGNVWNNLTVQDILYLPRNMRSNHVYGFSPVEQVIVTINMLLRRQSMQLAYFTEGNVPQGLINAPEGWTQDQIADFQAFVDSKLTGNDAGRAKLLWVPNNSKYQAFKESPIKDEFDEWLARIVCYCFSMPPTPFIRSMNKGTAQEDQDRALEEGLSPTLVWVKRLCDSVIQDEFGFSDLEFNWDLAPEIDAKTQAAIQDISLKNGTLTINEARAMRGMGPLDGGDKAYIYTGNGAIPVDSLEKVNDINMKVQEQASKPKPTAGKGKQVASPRSTREPGDREDT